MSGVFFFAGTGSDGAGGWVLAVDYKVEFIVLEVVGEEGEGGEGGAEEQEQAFEHGGG